MHRTDNATSATDQPIQQPIGPNPDGFFRTRNFTLGEEATIVDADFLNSIQEEICNVILASGAGLNKANQSQLLDAIQILIDENINVVSPTLLKTISQPAHGFLKGEIVRFDGAQWVRTIASSLDTSWSYGMVYEVQSTAIFKMLMIGWVDGLAGLTPGATYYMSPTIPGAMQDTPPDTNETTNVIVPVFVADSATSGYFYNYGPGLGASGGSIPAGLLLAENNLSDLVNVGDARVNLGLGTAAVASAGDFLITLNNLSDINNKSLARTNLGLGTAAVANMGDFIPVTDYTDFMQASASSSFQPKDATLTAFAGLNIQNGKLAYGNGADSFALTDLSSFVISLLDDTDAPSFRSSLGLGSAATASSSSFAPVTHTHAQADITNLTTDLAAKQPLDATLSAFAALNIASGKLAYGSGTDTFTLADLSPFIVTLLDDVDAATARATLGVGAGGGGGGITWNNVGVSAVTLAPLNGYVCNNGATVITFTIPASAAVGDAYKICGNSTGLWKVQANTGQTVNVLATPTTVAGTVNALNRFDCIEIVCTVADTTFTAIPAGNLNVL